jgi:hypothetical protein
MAVSAHGFNRAALVSEERELQPLKVVMTLETDTWLCQGTVSTLPFQPPKKTGLQPLRVVMALETDTRLCQGTVSTVPFRPQKKKGLQPLRDNHCT